MMRKNTFFLFIGALLTLTCSHVDSQTSVSRSGVLPNKPIPPGIIASTRPAAKWALIIAISDYKNLPPAIFKTKISEFTDLTGPRNDARIMKSLLVTEYGFANENIMELLEANASRQGILNAFDALQKKSQKGDLVLIYFSGHGSQIPDQNGDEADGYDEVLCPWDVDSDTAANIIIDDEFGELLNKFSDRECVVIVDSCHSGTSTRNLESMPCVRSRYLPLKAEPVIIKRGALPPPVDYQGQIFLAAARDFEKALEIGIPQDSSMVIYGGFTYSLVKTLSQHPRTNYRDLYRDVKKYMNDNLTLPQNPQIQPSVNDKTLEREVFFIAAKQAMTQPAVSALRPSTPAPTQPAPTQAAPVLPIKTPAPTPAPPSPTPPPMIIVQERLYVYVEPFTNVDSWGMNNIMEGLRQIHFVGWVSEESKPFDRLIRGEWRDGKYDARILTRVGDVTATVGPFSDPRELVKALRQPLEYAYCVKQLYYLQPVDSSFKVRLWGSDEDKRDFKIGEEIVFNFRAEEDCYLILLHFFNCGDCKVIFPNQFQKDNKIKANSVYQIPDENLKKEEDFVFRFAAPAGEETIKAIAVTKQVDFARLNLRQYEGGFLKIGSPKAGEFSPMVSLVRDIALYLQEPELRWATDYIVIRSHE